MALAELTDYEARHGEVPDDRQSVVSTLLEDASSLILDAVEGSEEPWALEEEGAEVPNSVIAVCVAVAFRAYTNPNALSRQALGAASYTYKGDLPDAIFLTDREVRLLQKAARRSRFQAVTLESPYSGPSSDSTIFDNDLPLDDEG